jgi:hypothetical protein
MPSRQPPGDLGHVLPFVKLTRAKLRELTATDAGHTAALDELRENDEKQDRKLSAHDESFGLLYRDLETLQTLMQAQVNAINETLTKIRGRLNGR